MISIMAAAPGYVVASSGAPHSTPQSTAPAQVRWKPSMTEADNSLAEQKQRASAWFERLRDELCSAFERLEADLPAGAPLSDRPPARFERTPWVRAGHAA